MIFWTWVVVIVVVSVVLTGFITYHLVMRRVEGRINSIPQMGSFATKIYPCYRCRVEASQEFMGLHYCTWCMAAVTAMYPAVKDDPPFGFPGSQGYLDFQEEEEKEKEIVA